MTKIRDKYIIVNLDKKEFFNPYDFENSGELIDFSMQSDVGALSGLAMLLADGKEKEIRNEFPDTPLVGTWKGDRIVIAGSQSDTKVKGTDKNLYSYAKENFEDIGHKVIAGLLENSYYKYKTEYRFNSSIGKESYKKALEFQKTYKNNGKKIKV